MDIESFIDNQKLHLHKTLDGAWAFVPPTLPPKIDLAQVARNLTLADRAIGELNGAARRLQNPYKLITPLIRKEALTTSAMEGTITTIDNMLLQEIAPDPVRDDDAREASNYKRALISSVQELEEIPISGRLLKNAHRILLSGLSATRGAGKRPGEYKQQQNAIGTTDDNVFTARYVPPPPIETEQCMKELESFINRVDRQPGEELLDLALAHYQFEAIHPFQDGNGRIGRMMICLMAMQTDLTALPLLHLSAFLEKRKEEYVTALYNVSTQGKWEPWINFFLEAVHKSCKNSTQTVDQIISLQTELKQRAFAKSQNHRLSTIIDSLFEKEWTTASEVQKLCGTTFPTAQRDIQQLVQIEILSHFFESTRPAIYIAKPIWDLSRRTN